MKFIDLAGFAPTEISRACTNLGISAGSRMDQQIGALIAGGFTLAQVKAAMSAPMTPAGVSANVDGVVAVAVAAAEARINAVLAGKADAAVVATIATETVALSKGLSTIAGKKAAAVPHLNRSGRRSTLLPPRCSIESWLSFPVSVSRWRQCSTCPVSREMSRCGANAGKWTRTTSSIPRSCGWR